VRKAEAQLQAKQLHRSCVSSHQVETELLDTTPKSELTAHVAITASPSSATGFAHITEVVEILVAALAQSQMFGPLTDSRCRGRPCHRMGYRMLGMH